MANDLGMLTAQSQAGAAGLAAYQQAQDQLAKAKQQAVQQAMQEAALRGASPLSSQAAASGVGDIADQRLATLAGNQATFQADMAARAQRMNDYSAAVDSARKLIPEQVQLAIAPIKAKSDADVAAIDAKARADLAMRAAARSGGGGGGRGGGGGSGKTLTASQTQALLGQGAAAQIQNLLGSAASISKAQSAVAPDRQATNMASSGANYAGAAAAYYDRLHPGASTSPTSLDPSVLSATDTNIPGRTGQFTPDQQALQAQIQAGQLANRLLGPTIKMNLPGGGTSDVRQRYAQPVDVGNGISMPLFQLPGAGPQPYSPAGSLGATGLDAFMSNLQSPSGWQDQMQQVAKTLAAKGVKLNDATVTDATTPSLANVHSYGDFVNAMAGIKPEAPPTLAEQRAEANDQYTNDQRNQAAAKVQQAATQVPNLPDGTVLGTLGDIASYSGVSDLDAVSKAVQSKGFADQVTQAQAALNSETDATKAQAAYKKQLQTIKDPVVRKIVAAVVGG